MKLTLYYAPQTCALVPYVTLTEAGGWALRITQLAVVATYVLAAAAKLRFGGVDWVSSSVLARAIIRSLSAAPDLEVPSPSFALVQPYDTARGPVLHADLYRLRGEKEMDELGLFDRPEAIVLVEWPERAPELRARARVGIRLSIPQNGMGRVAEIVT